MEGGCGWGLKRALVRWGGEGGRVGGWGGVSDTHSRPQRPVSHLRAQQAQRASKLWQASSEPARWPNPCA